MDELTQVYTAEENNRLTATEHLGDTTSLVQDFCDAHAKLIDLLGETKPPDPDLLVVTAHLVMAVRYQLVTGALAILRGHLTDSMQILRRAVELVAVAHRLYRSPELKDVWIRATPKDPALWKEYRKAFGARQLFPEDHPLLQELYREYKMGSDAFHTSISSLAHRTTIEEEDGRVLLNQQYFELDQDDPSEPPRTFLYMLDVHLGILHLFTSEVFAEQLAPKMDQWKAQILPLVAKLQSHKDRWKPTILAKRNGPAT